MSALGVLLRQRVRRDRVQVPLWILGTALLAAMGHPAVASSYGDAQERAALLATVMANPVILLFRGLPSGADQWQLVCFLMLPWLLMLAALMSGFLAVRHTRGDEEAGRLELLASTAASRWMPTVATAVHGIVANVLLGILVAGVFLGGGAPGGGAVLAGAACAFTGIVFLTVGLAAAQLMPTSRGANSLTTWLLVGTFLFAGIGNALGTPSDDLTRVESSWLTWLSPFGWAENTRAFDTDLWAPVGLLAALAVALIAGALVLQARRDLGAAFVPERTGRRGAPAWLASNSALVTRLATPSIIGWLVGGFIAGLLSTSLGALAGEIGGSNPAVADILDKLSGGDGGGERAMVIVFFLMMGVLAACAGVQTTVRARQDEAHGTAEIVLAGSLGRVRWLVGYVVVAAIAAALTIAAAVAGAAVGAQTASAATRGDLLRDAALAGLGQVLAAWVFIAITALLFVVLPRVSIGVGWALVLFATVIGVFGPLFGLGDATTNLSPFAAAPAPTADGIDAHGAVWLTIVTVVVLGGAFGLMRRRELATGG